MNLRKKSMLLLILSLGAFGIIYLLFTASENIIHYKNNFTRRFPGHVATEIASFDLKFNSYYLAGADNGRVYLGNPTTPLYVTILGTALKASQTRHILLPAGHPFKAPMLRVEGSRFYLYEGTLPVIYEGSTSDWKAFRLVSQGPRFTNLIAAGKEHLAMRFIHPGTGENLPGSMNIKSGQFRFGDSLLRKQIDGVFDTDGMLQYDRESKQLVHVYFYRNEITISDVQMRLQYRAKTIDTIGKANIELVVSAEGRRTFAKPPLMVNKAIAADGGLLFVNSTLRGQYDSKQLWKDAAIVDVYDLKDGAYRSSFPIYDIDRKRLNSFLVRDQKLFALIHNHIVCYKLKPGIRALNKATEKKKK